LQYARASNNSQFLAQVTEPKVLCTLANPKLVVVRDCVYD
jgi:hypothetical protein